MIHYSKTSYPSNNSVDILRYVDDNPFSSSFAGMLNQYMNRAVDYKRSSNNRRCGYVA